MIATAKRSARYSVHEREALLGEYKASEGSQKEWCKKHGISLSTLGKWLKSSKNQNSGIENQNWVQAAIGEETKKKTILLKTGSFCIVVEKETDMELLSLLLQVLVPLC